MKTIFIIVLMTISFIDSCNPNSKLEKEIIMAESEYYEYIQTTSTLTPEEFTIRYPEYN